MSLQNDLHGLPLTTASEGAAKAFDRTLLAYLRGRLDTMEWLHATLAADPGFALAHCLKGYLTMLAQRRSLLEVAADAHRAAARLGALDSSRERAHVAALGSWVDGDVEGALKIWKQIIEEHPTDVLALRLAHFNDFWLGRAHEMLVTVAAARAHWDRDLPADGMVQSLHAFALNECGYFAEAEREARCSVGRDPLDLWGVHAGAHALQSQGRLTAASDWIESAQPSFNGANQMIHHLEWHGAMVHLQSRNFDRVLQLYDDRIRNLHSPMIAAQPHFFLDIMNAASLLWYLRCEGISVGERWDELADQAEEAWNDALSAFVLPHWMMAVAATGRRDIATRMLGVLRSGRFDRESPRHLVRDVAAPVCEAIWLHATGQRSEAVRTMTALRNRQVELGGSMLQRAVLDTLLAQASGVSPIQ